MAQKAAKSPFDVFRLGRGSCDQLTVTDSRGGVHAGDWHQAGFEHARRPVFCDAKGLGCKAAVGKKGAQARALYLDLRIPAWTVNLLAGVANQNSVSVAAFDSNRLKVWGRGIGGRGECPILAWMKFVMFGGERCVLYHEITSQS